MDLFVAVVHLVASFSSSSSPRHHHHHHQQQQHHHHKGHVSPIVVIELRGPQLLIPDSRQSACRLQHA